MQGRGAFYEEAGALRDVVQNHLFQVLSNLTMEAPAVADSESYPRRKSKGPQGDSAAWNGQRVRGPVSGLP